MDQLVHKRKKWHPENMRAALDAIQKGSKIKTAAKNFNVPSSTIRDRLKSGENYNPRMGRKLTFNKEEEEELVALLSLMAKTFYGITQQQLRKFAYDFAIDKNVTNIFSSQNKMAGKCWYYSFLKRNPDISISLLKPTQLTRESGFNKADVKIYYSNLGALMASHNFPAHRIFNVDEITIKTIRNQNVTVVCAFSASGIYVSPMFIFPRQRNKPSLGIGGPPGAVYECSKLGCINEELFIKWLQHFTKTINVHSENPALLILDDHCSHQSLGAFKFCRENGIHLISLPPHSSYKMQPLELTFCDSLKSAYSKEYESFIKIHHKFTHDHFATIFNNAYARVATMAKAVKGFEVSGIYPLKPHIFGDDDDDTLTDSIIEVVPSFGQIHQSQSVDDPLIESMTEHDESNPSLISSTNNERNDTLKDMEQIKVNPLKRKISNNKENTEDGGYHKSKMAKESTSSSTDIEGDIPTSPLSDDNSNNERDMTTTPLCDDDIEDTDVCPEYHELSCDRDISNWINTFLVFAFMIIQIIILIIVILSVTESE